VLDELDFLVWGIDDVCIVEVCVRVACVVFDELLDSSPPPLPNTHEPCITPALLGAKKVNSASDMSSAPSGQEGHSSAMVAP